MSTLLNEVYKRGNTIDLSSLRESVHHSLVRAIQTKLCGLGILDPMILGDRKTVFKPQRPDDGIAGPETMNSLVAFQRCQGVLEKDIAKQLTPDFFRLLADMEPDTLYPISLYRKEEDSVQAVFAKRILRYMRKRGYFIASSPDMFNIVYVEGVDADGRPNLDLFDQWNDRRCVIRILPGGEPEMVVNDLATTEPGKYHTQNPSVAQGVARIAFGQYKAWRYGFHKSIYPALVQTGKVRLHRDMNKNFVRDASDFIDVGSNFGINQHSTRFNLFPTTVNEFSAGCLVGHRYNYHLSFLHIVKQDYRYVNNTNYRFITTVINGDKLLAEEPISD